ncbi:HAD-IIIC family phosphatase [Actinoplanes sp. NBRC 103695]|uniref:HAD-IIIC family phosphatase n=1 Tax=Actinoplanes sp. NBRC 103695 TaxID=3032202 RepID=UPI0024A154D3|nr:HAD-IIIC family phosphatase [Actinoplanes sp. NBRC 103695]GLZ01158.1 hypothetical protein Acsp02_84090 [Actinoplanes sp. NBRC 103695]
MTGLIKCVIWDLDDTVWAGTLAEGRGVRLSTEVREAIETLDQRGILQSVASKNASGPALAELSRLGLHDYFLAPQISWQPKSDLVAEIAQRLDVALDAVLFIDDSEFERAEVSFSHPQVRCAGPEDLPGLLRRPDLNRPITADGRNRRALYRQAEQRNDFEKSFQGPRLEFLRSLDMRVDLSTATIEHLERAAELTERTHQLNTTGVTFTPQELARLIDSPDHLVLVAELQDRFGSYGTIGLAVVARGVSEWRIRLFLMSCRVMGRNIGGTMLTYLERRCAEDGVQLTADFLATEVNAPMYKVYRLAGLQPVGDPDADGVRTLVLPPRPPRSYPDYLTVTVPAKTGGFSTPAGDPF